MRLFVYVCLLLCLSLAAGSTNIVCAASADAEDSMYDPFEKTGGDAGAAEQQVADPLEKFNRGMFVFNDKLYFWVLKPAAQGYSYVVPEPARMCVKRFFLNLVTPVRMVNCCCRENSRVRASELTRFTVNSTSGIGGLFDPSYYCWGLTRTGRTFRQLRRRPRHLYCLADSWALQARGIPLAWSAILSLTRCLMSICISGSGPASRPIRKSNNVSLKIDEYDEFKKSAVDPYVSLKTAYIQNRQHGLRK